MESAPLYGVVEFALPVRGRGAGSPVRVVESAPLYGVVESAPLYGVVEFILPDIPCTGSWSRLPCTGSWSQLPCSLLTGRHRWSSGLN